MSFIYWIPPDVPFQQMPCLNYLSFLGLHSTYATHAQLTEGFTGRDIKAIVARVCTPSRQASKRRLRNAEFIPALAAHYPDSDAPTLEDWVKWYLTTPLMQARKALIEGIVEEEEALAAGKAGKKR